MKTCRCCKKEVDEAGMWRKDPDGTAGAVVHLRCYARLTGQKVKAFQGLEGTFDQPREAHHQGETEPPITVRFAE